MADAPLTTRCAPPPRQAASPHRRVWRALAQARLYKLLASRSACRLALAGLAIQALAVMLDVSLWRCPMHEATRLPCPGCDLTRATIALLQGDVPAMLRLHPFAPLVAAVAGLCAVAAVLPARARRALAGAVAVGEGRWGLTAWWIIAFLAYACGRLVWVGCGYGLWAT